MRFEDFSALELLGSGSTGKVHRAINRSSGQVRALKSVPLSHGHILAMEVKALSTRCPGMISLDGILLHEDVMYLVLQYMDGGCLEKVVRQRGAFPEPVAAALAFQLLWCLQHLRSAHLLHRDIKPSNVLLDCSGRVRLGDAGLAAFLQNSAASAHSFVGTCRYMSPERIKHGTYSFPADVWGLGLSLWYAVVGGVPFPDANSYVEVIGVVTDSEEIVEIPPEGTPTGTQCAQVNARPLSLSPQFRELILCCCHKDPLKRLTPDALMLLPVFKIHDIKTVAQAECILKNFLGGPKEGGFSSIYDESAARKSKARSGGREQKSAQKNLVII